MPSSLQAQITRKAISPRLATRIFWNMSRGRLLFPARTNAEEGLSVLYGLSIFGENADHFAGGIRFNLVHELHGFHDAEHLPGFDVRANLHEGIRAWAGGSVEGSYDGRLDHMQILTRSRFGMGRGGGVRSVSWVVCSEL